MWKDLNILIVEDQESVRNVLRSMLKSMGAERICEAEDAKEALAFVHSDSAIDAVNFILCDWNMPGMSGLEFLKHLRKGRNNIPFLMVTGRNDMNSVMEAKIYGASGYLVKPFSSDHLEAKMRTAWRHMAYV